MIKYPELRNIDNWSPREIYIHRTRLIIGLVIGFLIGVAL